MAASDGELVRRAKAGDRDAFRGLVERYRGRVYGIARGMTGNHGDADDVAQETFIKAYRKLGDFEGQSAIYTWLYRIAVNSALDLLRRKSRRGELGLDRSIEEAERRLAAARKGPPDGAAEAGAAELRRAVAGGLAELPARHRAVLVLHDIEGMPHEEISRILGCPPGTVRSRLHYARARMQRKLKDFIG